MDHFVLSELIFDRAYRIGDNHTKVKIIQEWLCLHGFIVSIDGKFGPQTQAAVKHFQAEKTIPLTGAVDRQTFLLLTRPMRNALNSNSNKSFTYSQLIAAFANQHLRQHPHEAGGANCGPWVRLYMKGCEGQQYSWCAGFVSFIISQAASSANRELPIEFSFSCDDLAINAERNCLLYSGRQLADKSKIPAGSVFLIRKAPTDWIHTGIVIKIQEHSFVTIEGNTNKKGHVEGTAVLKRDRSYDKCDFIIWP
ncbi:MAG: peptidoglycan-binding protein [candidate division Zixibacteria bacterium]|nr:peptidoglycan-binding protein [candidate division Zixibacteria bacterium]